MLRRTRTLVAIFLAVALLAMPTVGFAASDVEKINSEPAPAVIDAAFIRPLGLAFLGVSALLWVPVAGITAITRPQEIDKTVDAMLVKPAQFVFSDPLGTH